MSVKFLIQDVERFNYVIHDDFKNLKELGFDIIPFGVISFTSEMTGVEDLNSEDIYIIRGGTKIVSMIEQGTISNISPDLLKNLRKSVHHNDKFDQKYYSKLCLPLLNNSPLIVKIEANLDLSFNIDKFVKPSSDMKAFNAGIMKKGTLLKDYIQSGLYRKEYMKENVLIHDCLKIHSEFRFICIKDKVISGSQYKESGEVKVNKNIPIEILDAAEKYCRLYQPDDIYTMDLCKMDNGEIKIVEYNCWNGAGLYQSDIKKIFKSVYEYYKNKYE